MYFNASSYRDLNDLDVAMYEKADQMLSQLMSRLQKPAPVRNDDGLLSKTTQPSSGSDSGTATDPGLKGRAADGNSALLPLEHLPPFLRVPEMLLSGARFDVPRPHSPCPPDVTPGTVLEKNADQK